MPIEAVIGRTTKSLFEICLPFFPIVLLNIEECVRSSLLSNTVPNRLQSLANAGPACVHGPATRFF